MAVFDGSTIKILQMMFGVTGSQEQFTTVTE